MIRAGEGDWMNARARRALWIGTVVLLALVNACNWDAEALLGREAPPETEGGGGSGPEPSVCRRLVWNSLEEKQASGGCTVPVDVLRDVTVTEFDQIEFIVSTLNTSPTSDQERFPEIQKLLFQEVEEKAERLQISFNCEWSMPYGTGGDALKIRCKPSEWDMDLSRNDMGATWRKMVMTDLILKNPLCSSTVEYTRKTESVPCGSGAKDSLDSGIGQADVPLIWARKWNED